jgi:hypothetical protein
MNQDGKLVYLKTSMRHTDPNVFTAQPNQQFTEYIFYKNSNLVSTKIGIHNFTTVRTFFFADTNGDQCLIVTPFPNRQETNGCVIVSIKQDIVTTSWHFGAHKAEWTALMHVGLKAFLATMEQTLRTSVSEKLKDRILDIITMFDLTTNIMEQILVHGFINPRAHNIVGNHAPPPPPPVVQPLPVIQPVVQPLPVVRDVSNDDDSDEEFDRQCEKELRKAKRKAKLAAMRKQIQRDNTPPFDFSMLYTMFCAMIFIAFVAGLYVMVSSLPPPPHYTAPLVSAGIAAYTPPCQLGRLNHDYDTSEQRRRDNERLYEYEREKRESEWRMTQERSNSEKKALAAELEASQSKNAKKDKTVESKNVQVMLFATAALSAIGTLYYYMSNAF